MSHLYEAFESSSDITSSLAICLALVRANNGETDKFARLIASIQL